MRVGLLAAWLLARVRPIARVLPHVNGEGGRVHEGLSASLVRAYDRLLLGAMRERVCGELICGLEASAAASVRAAEVLSVLMFERVFLEASSLCVNLSAAFVSACVGFLARVCSQMRDETARLSKFLIAARMLTDEWFLSSMCSHMYSQSAGEAKGFSAAFLLAVMQLLLGNRSNRSRFRLSGWIHDYILTSNSAYRQHAVSPRSK